MICWLSNGDGSLGGQHYKPSVVGGGVGVGGGGRLRNKKLAGGGGAEEMTGLPQNCPAPSPPPQQW